MMMGLQSRCSGLQLQESVRAELQRLLADAEQQWRTVLQAAAQAELRTLSDDFDSQSLNTQSWIRQKQQQLQTVGAQTPPEERSLAAQVGADASTTSQLFNLSLCLVSDHPGVKA